MPFFIGLVGAVALDERTVTVSHMLPSTIKIPAVAPTAASSNLYRKIPARRKGERGRCLLFTKSIGRLAVGEGYAFDEVGASAMRNL